MKINADHRRHALCVASQLPDDPEDAWAILECVKELLTYVHADDPAEAAKATVVTLVRDCPDRSA